LLGSLGSLTLARHKQLTGFMDNGGGWGIQFINGFYNLTHPLASRRRPLARSL
jgi:hypothetical protein